MASLKSLKNRIKTVRSTQKITKAMKMVAASKLKRARECAIAARPYAEQMLEMITSLSGSYRAMGKSLLTGNGRSNTHLLLICTADRGLCGAFNSGIIRLAKQHINTLTSSGHAVKLVCIGQKGYEYFKRTYPKLILTHRPGPGGKHGLSFREAEKIAEMVIDLFNDDQFDVCNLYYSQFKSAISQVPTAQQLIPLPLKTNAEPEHYETESAEGELIERLLPRNIAAQVFSTLLENSASEQGARMTAMDNATRNSGEMIDKLNLLYNRTRQAHITKELIEIISGAEAV
ncbi:MAG: F0F1 ATP synthase subunit gamma [Proteobacteria bacterium]|nr:F0F1 ATP synthase subunit gamma [Pseudomonadota bacterium]